MSPKLERSTKTKPSEALQRRAMLDRRAAKIARDEQKKGSA